jgi:hypothetical protein
VGFWDVTKRLLQGKPGFVPPPRDDTWDDDAPTTDYAEDREAKRQQSGDARISLYDAKGYKQIPPAQVTKVQYDIDGPNMEVWAVIENQSQRSLMLDKFTLIGQTVELGYRLEPGLNHEFRIYRGKRPTHGSYTKASLYYKDHVTGDYFRADHMVGYHFEPHDHTYAVEELTLMSPIRDV